MIHVRERLPKLEPEESDDYNEQEDLDFLYGQLLDALSYTIDKLGTEYPIEFGKILDVRFNEILEEVEGKLEEYRRD